MFYFKYSMFNTGFVICLVFLILYTLNLLVFVVMIGKKSSYHNNKKISRRSAPFLKRSIFLSMVVIMGGLPPVSFFFFKIFILLQVKNTMLVVYLMCLANVAILYYYLNFVVYFSKNNSEFRVYDVLKLFWRDCNRYLTMPVYYSLIFYCSFMNFYFMFFLEFLLALFQSY